ncbi:MAG TPA: hypothetical protein VJ965_10085 [Anaerolineales bacterium]|nr:hypothetical protein [Anaerolineales bacterium]
MGSPAEVTAPCGCGECDNLYNAIIEPGTPIISSWLVHFIVPARQFWDQIGYT